jgi:hypothetical protein
MGAGILKAHGPDSKEFLRRFLQKAASFCVKRGHDGEGS